MPPKPFPLPFGVGIDVCRIERILKIVENGDRLNRWARKIFTRSEWPWIYEKAKIAYEGIQNRALTESTTEGRFLLPNILQGIPLDYKTRAGLAPVSLHINNLAQFFAGRWAAKEAAIKAHRHRKLFYRDVSIIPTLTSPENTNAQNLSQSHKAFLLIEPVPHYVVMKVQVAISRGLQGFDPGKPLAVQSPKSAEAISGEVVEGNFVPGTGASTKQFVLRKRLVQEKDRQVAELSISHDGPYATAVCMALDQESEDFGTPVFILDDGSGSPLHEPIWGDRGWLSEPLSNW